MKPADDPILEYLEVAGEVTPATIGRNVELHPGYASRRVRALARTALVESPEEGWYRITDDGRRYLAGELDAGTLDAPE